MAAAIIELQGVHKSYASGVVRHQALNDVSLRLDTGSYTAIIGHSGSGKSTLLNILGCLDAPTAGRYLLAGESVAELSDRRVAALRGSTIGFVFQSFHLLKRLKIVDNVALPAVYAGASRSTARRRAMHRLEEFGVAQLAERLPGELSGGQQQRCAIARALVNNPKILLADEPTGNLDSENTSIVVDAIERLNQEHGVAIVLVTHETEIAKRASRVIRMRDGLIVYDGEPQRNHP